MIKLYFWIITQNINFDLSTIFLLEEEMYKIKIKQIIIMLDNIRI